MTFGVVLMFFNKLQYTSIIYTNVDKFFNNMPITNFFVAFFGSFIFAWGIFFFLLTVFAVMELKNTSIYPFIFWGFTFWAVLSGVVSFLNKFNFLLICIGVVYALLFLPFFVSLAFKSKSN